MSRRGWAAALCLAGFAACGESPAPPPAPPANPPGADWPIFRGDPALSGVAPGALGGKPTLAWTFPTGDAILSSPVVAEGVVYVGSTDGALYAIDLETGGKRWSYATKDAIEAPPLVHEGRVYVGSSDAFLYAIEAKTGDLVFKAETGDKILGSANVVPAPGGGTRIVVGSYDTKLYCFDARNGSKVWDYETDNYVNGTPAVLGDRIVFGGCDAILHVVSAATGKAIAKVELGDGCHVAGSVGLAEGRAYLGHYGNEFTCIDLAKGARVWSYESRDQPFFSSPAIGADRVLFGGRDKKLHCAERATGKPIWTFPTRRKVDGSPVLCGDKVIFGSGDGRLYLLGLADGKELWSYDIGQPVFSSPAVAHGTIVVGANDGKVYAFRAAPE